MSGRLEEKKTLITAAGQGIGRASALAYANEGARVLATDINSESLASLKEESPETEVCLLDVTDPQAIKDLAKATGTLDVLFNCAGFVHHGTLHASHRQVRQLSKWSWILQLLIQHHKQSFLILAYNHYHYYQLLRSGAFS